jgi:Ca2+/Na+ antiporter
MIPENVDSSQGLYLIGSIILVVGIVAGVAGLLIKRRLEEQHRDERYVRERRGEEVVQAELPRIAVILQYAGVAIVAFGIVVLVAGWTVAPGQT